MKDKILYAIDIKSVVTISIFGIILGALLSFVSINTLANLIVVVIGIIMIATNGVKLYYKTMERSESSNEMILDALGIMLGFFLIISGNHLLTIIVSIYLLLEPIVYLWLFKFKKEMLMTVLPRIILGIILLVSGVSTFALLFKILGYIILIGSLSYLGINYYLYKKSGVKIIKKSQ